MIEDFGYAANTFSNKIDYQKLSEARAAAVARYLQEVQNIPDATHPDARGLRHDSWPCQQHRLRGPRTEPASGCESSGEHGRGRRSVKKSAALHSTCPRDSSFETR